MLKRLFSLFSDKSKNENQNKKTFLAECGHECKEVDNITAFGETIQTKLPIVKGKTKYCHKCLEKMAICCAWCGKPIFIGDQITLYSTDVKDFKAPEGSVVHRKETLTYVGCQRRYCAETGADYCGVWVPPGEVYRRPSAIELALANTGCAIFVNDGKTEIIPIDKK